MKTHSPPTNQPASDVGGRAPSSGSAEPRQAKHFGAHKSEASHRTTGYPDRIIRLPEVLYLTGISRSTLYDKMKKRTFPQSRSLGGWIVGWSMAEVMAWVADPR